jgi:hypothetical protein
VLLLVPRFFPAHGPSPASGSRGSGAALHFRHPELLHRPAPQGRVGNKKTHPKNPPKKPTKMGFLGFFKCLIFYENNTNFSL